MKPQPLHRRPPFRRWVRRFPARYCRCGHTYGVHDVDRRDCLVQHCGCEHFVDEASGAAR